MVAVAVGVPYLLNQAIQETGSIIRTHGDGLAGGNGLYSVRGSNGLDLFAWDADNHQLTWGVLREACMALFDYMRRNDDFGSARFEVYDGNHKVAEGMIS